MNVKEKIKELLETLSYSVRDVCDVLLDHEERVRKLEVAVEEELQFLGLLAANVMDSRKRIQLYQALATIRETLNLNRTEEAKP
jgi:hypothetical protein